MSVSETNREKMAVFSAEEYDDGEVFKYFYVSPERCADGPFGSTFETNSICTCNHQDDAVAIAEAWNAYHIKN